jgi:hypothetical protein
LAAANPAFWVSTLALRPGGLSRKRFKKAAKASATAQVIAAVSSRGSGTTCGCWGCFGGKPLFHRGRNCKGSVSSA